MSTANQTAETKEEKEHYEYPVDIFRFTSTETHYMTTSSAWKDITGCRKTITVGELPVFCEVVGLCTAHNAATGGGALDFGISISNDIEGCKVHENAVGKGLGITHTQSWTNMTCHWTQELQAHRTYCIQLQIRSRDNQSSCAVWSPSMIIKTYKQSSLTRIVARLEAMSSKMDALTQSVTRLTQRLDTMEQTVNKLSLHSNLSKEQRIIKHWLENTCKLPQYFELFMKHKVNDVSLVKTLTHEVLQQMGIEAVGDRQRILTALKQIDTKGTEGTNFM